MPRSPHEGRKNRKHGRNKRRPGKVRYTLERRWITNKSRRVLRCNGERAWALWREGLTVEDAGRARRVTRSRRRDRLRGVERPIAA